MMNKTPVKIWLTAFRLQTLPAAIAPVILGTAMAYGDGIHHWSSAGVALLGALLIQIGTNLANDYFDYQKGTDTEDRVGPLRVTQAGLIEPQKVISASILIYCLAALCCIWLVLRAGWPVAVIGVLSILSGIFYTAGPRPLGYMGLGEIFVLFFFGPIAVGGTYYVQSFEINAAVLWAGCAAGLLSSAILVVNNLRDIETDRRSRKLTLAVRFGRSFAQFEYMFLMITAAVIPIIIYAYTRDHIETLFAPTILYFALPAFRDILTKIDGQSLNKTLAFTGKLLLFYSIVFSIGWIV